MSGTGERASEQTDARSGRHAAPRHAGRGSEPVRFDTTRLPTVEAGASKPSRGGAAGALLGLALGITAAVVAWGYLVYVAIDFGSAARNGDNRAWVFLALAAVGAMACLFVGLVLVERLVGRLRGRSEPAPPARVPGGRRARR